MGKQDKTILAITGALTGFGLGVLASYVLLNKKKHKRVSNNTQHRRRFPSFFRRFSHRNIESNRSQVHVLTVTLTFSSKSDKEAYKKYWAPLAEKVERAEKNCLSYECTFT